MTERYQNTQCTKACHTQGPASKELKTADPIQLTTYILYMCFLICLICLSMVITQKLLKIGCIVKLKSFPFYSFLQLSVHFNKITLPHELLKLFFSTNNRLSAEVFSKLLTAALSQSNCCYSLSIFYSHPLIFAGNRKCKDDP